MALETIEKPEDLIDPKNFTWRYGLAQPQRADFVRVNDLNWNFQVLDKRAFNGWGGDVIYSDREGGADTSKLATDVIGDEITVKFGRGDSTTLFFHPNVEKAHEVSHYEEAEDGYEGDRYEYVASNDTYFYMPTGTHKKVVDIPAIMRWKNQIGSSGNLGISANNKNGGVWFCNVNDHLYRNSRTIPAYAFSTSNIPFEYNSQPEPVYEDGELVDYLGTSMQGHSGVFMGSNFIAISPEYAFMDEPLYFIMGKYRFESTNGSFKLQKFKNAYASGGVNYPDRWEDCVDLAELESTVSHLSATVANLKNYANNLNPSWNIT